MKTLYQWLCLLPEKPKNIHRMGTINRFFAVCFFSLLTISCVDPVEVPQTVREVFVKCILVNDSTQKAELYYSAPMGSSCFEPVEDASVQITGPYDIYSFIYAGDGVYVCDFQPRPERTYRLDIQIPGKEAISATTEFPEEMRISSAFYPPHFWGESGFLSSLFPRLGFDGFFHTFPWNANPILRSSVDSNSIHSLLPGIIFRFDSPYPSSLYIFGVNEKGGEWVRAQHLASTHAFVNNPPYDASSGSFNSGNAVAMSDSSIRSCFDYSIRAAYDGLPLYEDYLRITSPKVYDNGLGELDNAFTTGVLPGGAMPQPQETKIDARSYFSIVGDVTYDYWLDESREQRSSLYFCAVSSEYNRYLESSRHYLFLNAHMQDNLLAALYHNALDGYSNIQGAKGIFGGMYVLRHDCDLQKVPAGTPDPLTGEPSIYDFGIPYSAYPASLPEL